MIPRARSLGPATPHRAAGRNLVKLSSSPLSHPSTSIQGRRCRERDGLPAQEIPCCSNSTFRLSLDLPIDLDDVRSNRHPLITTTGESVSFVSPSLSLPLPPFLASLRSFLPLSSSWDISYTLGLPDRQHQEQLHFSLVGSLFASLLLLLVIIIASPPGLPKETPRFCRTRLSLLASASAPRIRSVFALASAHFFVGLTAAKHVPHFACATRQWPQVKPNPPVRGTYAFTAPSIPTLRVLRSASAHALSGFRTPLCRLHTPSPPSLAPPSDQALSPS